MGILSHFGTVLMMAEKFTTDCTNSIALLHIFFNLLSLLIMCDPLIQLGTTTAFLSKYPYVKIFSRNKITFHLS